MHNLALLIVAVGILGFGLISKRAQTSILTPPLVFAALGLAVSRSGLLDLHLSEDLIHLLAELTLVLVLFTDASRINLGLLRRQHDLPVRLLAVGMPLTVVLGGLAALWLFPGFTLWEAALLAAVLAPTDAALGQAVVSSPRVPVRIRQALNVESGLNDGIALPLVLLLMSACAAAVSDAGGAGYWLRFAVLQVTLGPAAGVLVGWLGGRLVERGAQSGWMNHTYQHLAALGLALLAYTGAELAGGNGFIAAFVAGLVLGNTASERLCECLYDFAEAEGQLLTLLVFLVFGLTMVPGAVDHLGWRTLLYAVLSLTVVRLLPVATSLVGARLSRPTVLFLGWFGPRGIASILFGLLVVRDSALAAREEIFEVVLLTVLLSVVAHGVTAYPGSVWYSRHTEGMHRQAQEHREVEEMRVRIRHTP